MSKPFDMDLFLDGVLTGSNSTRQRHLRQARAIHAAIAKRWQRDTPWGWKRKHLVWFLEHQLSKRAGATRYYYLLTAKLLAQRLQKTWAFSVSADSDSPSQ
ncbi:hypothetical protein [Pseudomonas mediterranea]|uniref:hypothetical protein n=1 Tax=Pseudomonas mediterranea TaxID=183795 RepID=UPI0009EC6C1D|nr:hypothetical protein [Pseudomonas mediterranea]UZE01733.1 hypothetical protein LOY71_03630 [Pseudomonas mediterranea]